MDVSSAVDRARQIAATVLSPSAADNDKQGRFSTDAVCSLGENGLLGLVLPASCGGAGLGARAFADVTATLAEADPSVAMVFMMHTLAAAVVASAPETPALRRVLEEMANGSHLSTLAFSEAGSRSHFWAPVSRAESRNGAGVRITARNRGSPARATPTAMSSRARARRAGPTDFDALPGAFRARAGAVGGGPLGRAGTARQRLRADDARGLRGDARAAADGRRGPGLQAMLEVVLPLFNLGTSAVSLGICRAAVAGTTAHLKSARFEHLGSIPRREPAQLSARSWRPCRWRPTASRRASTTLVAHLEQPRPVDGASRARSQGRGRGDGDRRHLARRCGRAAGRRLPGIRASSDCSAMPTRVPSWRRPAMSCASSSAAHSWACRCSERGAGVQSGLPRCLEMEAYLVN